ncbi:MAG: MFS transporter [Chitinophagales bacterium]
MAQLDDRKTILAWSLYDWANSAFATTVMAGFFPIFFKMYWNTGVDPVTSTARLGIANSVASVFIVLLAPFLGSIADQGSAKKKFLFFFAFMGIVMTCGLFFVTQGNWLLAMLLYMAATIGFSGSNIFYDALLPSIASEKKLDFVSALGFSLGYLGGGVLFAVNVAMVLSPETFGFADKASATQFSFLTVGLWWAMFSIPIFLWVEEPKNQNEKPKGNLIVAGFRQLTETFREIKQLKTIFLFLLAYWLYIDGVDTIVRMSVDYGMSIGFEDTDLITALLLVQFVGFPAAIAFGFLGQKIGAKAGIYIAIFVYLGISVGGAFIDEKHEFYIMAAVIGLVQGGIQALSRSYYARMIPKGKTAEFFGFYNMLGKFAAVIGPALMGFVGLFIRNMGYTSDFASRASITSIAILFILGAIIFYFVDEEKAKQEVADLYGE